MWWWWWGLCGWVWKREPSAVFGETEDWGREEKAVLDLQTQALGEAPLHLERPGIEAHFPAWWAVLALKSPAWAAPSTMNFLKSFEIPWSLLVPGRAGTDRGGQEEGLGEAVGRAILGAGPWPALDSGSRLENQGWEGLEVWEALGLQLPS